VKYLYADPEKAQAMEEIMLEFLKLLEALMNLSLGQTQSEPPSSLLFCYYYLSQHYNVLKQTEKALEFCEKCIKHTPTQVDFYVLKARIYKDAGQFTEGAKWMEEARTLDLADRWLNTKATLYFLRADQVENAEKTISIFTKVEAISEQNYNNILDMQVVWYEQEEGQSWVRQKNYGKALKRFRDIIDHFHEFWSDQMDFHSYCTKKMTLRQYVNFLKMIDTLPGHKFYVKAAAATIQCYLDIDANPELAVVKKDETKPEAQKEEPKKQVKSGKNEKDHNGTALLGLGLDEANKYVKKLTKFAPQNITTHLLAYQVALRRKKFLLALQAVNRARAIDAENPQAKANAAELFATYEKVKGSLPAPVQKVFDAQKK